MTSLLLALFTPAPPLSHPPADADEDDIGATFAHKAIAGFKYREELKTLQDFEDVSFAYRMLSALLRLWSMATKQLRDARCDREPIVQTHIRQLSEIVTAIFTVSRSEGKSVADAANGQGSSGTEKARSGDGVQAGPSKLTDVTNRETKERSRAVKKLSSGQVDADVIKRLTKKVAVQLAEKANIELPPKIKKEEVHQYLITALNSGKLKVTATEIVVLLKESALPDHDK
ncbi:hypothetical protein V8E36_000434 [Tilletia maclaganii]